MRFILVLLAILAAGPLAAQTDVVEDITAELVAEGYVLLDRRNTLLGRTQIVVRLGDEVREIVIDPNTGEILRDLPRPATDVDALPEPAAD